MAKGMPGQQQQQTAQDSSLDFLWIIGAIIVSVILAWYFGKVHIISFVLHVRFYEIIAIDYFFNLWSKIVQGLGFVPPHFDFASWLIYAHKNIGVELSFADLTLFSTSVGNFLKYPLTLLTFGGAAWLYFGGAQQRFRHIFDTKLFKKREQKNWPQIVPVVNLDLIKEPLDDGPWAIALSPMNFCKKHGLLDVEEKGGKYNVTLKRGAAYRILSLQLGPRWIGVESLPIHLKALFAIFAARINGDKNGSEDLLDQIAASASGSNINFHGVEELLRKNSGSKKVAKVISVHGYVATVLASMLVAAREVGVLATSEFIWLKPIDRRMWYVLNSVGRPTVTAEVCGAFAHWLAEKRLGLPIAVPMVDEAVKGLEIAISDIIYKPDEED